MVGQATDVEEVGIRLPVQPVCHYDEIQCHIKKVNNFLVHCSSDSKAVLLIHMLNLLPQPFCQAVGQPLAASPSSR